MSRPKQSLTELQRAAEADLVALHQVGQPLQLQARQAVPLEQAGFLYLCEGALDLRPGGLQGGAVRLQQGDWLELPLSTGAVFAAQATAPAQALHLSSEAVRALPPTLRKQAGKRSREVRQTLLDTLVDQLQREEERARRLRHLAAERVAVAARTADAEFVRTVIANMPGLPVYASQLLTRLHDEDSSAREVTQAAKEDPSLVTAILKQVNSARYGLPKPVTDLQRAVSLLGFAQIHRLVMSIAVRGTMPDKPAFRELQDHAISVSHLAYEIARLAGLPGHGEISTIALVHDVGRSVLLLMQEKWADLRLFLEIADADRIGGRLLRHWNLPETLVAPVELQQEARLKPPSELPEAYARNTALLHIAHRCDDLLSETPQEPPGACERECLEYLGFSEPSAEELLNRRLLPALRTTAGKFEVRI